MKSIKKGQENKSIKWVVILSFLSLWGGLYAQSPNVARIASSNSGCPEVIQDGETEKLGQFVQQNLPWEDTMVEGEVSVMQIQIGQGGTVLQLESKREPLVCKSCQEALLKVLERVQFLVASDSTKPISCHYLHRFEIMEDN